MTSFTASGARRTGDEYQDLQSAEVLIHWLEQPGAYQWVHLEVMDGSLDDIQILESDGRMRLLQVKFATNPSERWDWDELLEEPRRAGGGTSPSLLQKWKGSLNAALSAGATVSEAGFYTNRQAANAVSDHLTLDGLIEFNRLPTALRQRIAAQLGGDQGATDFFARFHFRFQERAPDALAAALLHRLRQLGGTTDGWWNLINNIRRWINRKDEPHPNGRILFDDVQAAALWHLPASIPQGFAIPRDYVAPRVWSERNVLPRLDVSQAVNVVTGPPGAGKSTYLSWLVDHLRSMDRPVIRHHYFLSTFDPTPGRSSWETAAGSLILQLKSVYPALVRDVAGKNPLPAKLRDYISEAGRHRRGGTPLVIAIDGLDHVWRDTGNDEPLRHLFDLLLPAPEGVVIIVGTQDVDIARLPLKLRDACPRASWMNIPALTLEEVHQWLEHHADNLGLPNEPDGRRISWTGIADAFHEVTSGHPLVLHYTLSQLTSVPSINADRVRSLPRFAAGSHIADYYARLFDTLSTEGRHLLHLLAGFSWAWPRDGLVQCLAPQADAARLDQAERDIRHVLGTSHAGVTAFHESLLSFIRTLPNHSTNTETLRPGVLRWLASSAPPYWRWRYEWVERERGGDPSSLISGPSLDWCVDALASGRRRHDIMHVLSASGWAALASGDLASATVRHLLDERLEDASASDNVLARLLLIGSVDRRGRNADAELNILATDRANASAAELAALCELAVRLDRLDICEEAEEELNSRWNREIAKDELSQAFSTFEEHFPFLIAAALRSPQRSSCRDALATDGKYPPWCNPARYARALRHLCALAGYSSLHRDELRFLANHPTLHSPEAADEIVRLACREGFAPDRWLTSSEASRAELLRAYAAMNGAPRSSGSEPRARSFAPAWAQFQDEGVFVELARSYFFCCFSSASMKATRPNATGVHAQADEVKELLTELAEFAELAAVACARGERIGGAWFLEQLERREHSEPAPNDYPNRFARCHVCSTIFVAIALDLEDLFHAATGRWSIGRDTLQVSFDARTTLPLDWIRTCAHQRRTLGDTSAAWAVVAIVRDTLAARVGYVGTRAEEYSLAALFCHLHGLAAAATKELLSLSARHLFGHGFHKDVVLFDYLDAIKACSSLEDEALIGSLRAAEPIIEVIGDITDGDETRHLPSELGNILFHRLPRFLPRYIGKLHWNYNHWQAEVVATELARAMPLATTFDRALASTLLHKDALKAWDVRANNCDEAARSIIGKLDVYLGTTAQRELGSRETAARPEREAERSSLPSVEAYLPAQLSAFVTAVRATGSYRDEHLVTWTRYWIERAPQELLIALDDYVRQHDDLPETSSVQQIVSLALEHTGREGAWRWLVQYHQSLYGWAHFMYPLASAQAIWRVVRDRFPERWLEFVLQTSQPRWRRFRAAPSWSMHRLVRFLSEVGKLEEARAVMEAARSWVCGLAANMQLPASTIDPEAAGPHCTLQLLVGRLDCPSRLVQDRASCELAALLGSPTTRTDTIAALGLWHANQPSEARSCLILQIIWLAATRFSLSNSEKNELVTAFARVSSPAERILVEHLGVGAGAAAAKPVNTPQSPEHKPAIRFPDVVRGHLAPCFLAWAATLDRRGLQFTQRWREMFIALARSLPIDVNNAFFHFHYRGSDDSGFLEISDLIADQLRCAYMRALEAFVDEGAITPQDSLPHQLRAALVMDPSFWTEPSSQPSWWPAGSSALEPQRMDIEVRHALRVRLEGPSASSNPVLLYAAGPLIATPRINVHLIVRAFLQSAVNVHKPAMGDVADVSDVDCIFADELTPLRTYSTSDQYAGRLDDWILAPLAWMTVRHNVHPWLRPQLAASKAPLPAAWLFDGPPRVTAAANWLGIADARGEHARCIYWNRDIRGRSYQGEGPHAGFELTCDRALMQPHLDAGADLCWSAVVLTTTRRDHGDSFEAPEVSMTALVGGSRIVWPTPWMPPRPISV